MSSIPRKFWCRACAFNVFTPHACPSAAPREPYDRPFPERTSNDSGSLILLPFSALSVPADAIATISMQPQVACRPVRLVVSPSIASYFDLEDMQIGKVSYVHRFGVIRTDCFPPDPVKGKPVNNLDGLPPIQPAQTMSLTIRNIDWTSCHPFSGYVAAMVQAFFFRISLMDEG